MNLNSNQATKQRGAALVMALSVLVLLTILGISAMKGSTLEYRMATSLQDTSVAFQAAESSLAEASASITLDVNNTVSDTWSRNSSLITAKTDTSYGGESTSSTTRSENPDGIGHKWIHFDQEATATLSSGATTTLKAGFKQRVNAN